MKQKIEEKIDVGSIVKKLKSASTGFLISAFATLTHHQLQSLQILVNTAMRTISEEKLREEIRSEIKKQMK